MQLLELFVLLIKVQGENAIEIISHSLILFIDIYRYFIIFFYVENFSVWKILVTEINSKILDDNLPSDNERMEKDFSEGNAVNYKFNL